MVFASPVFLFVFLPLVFLVYYAVSGNRARNIFLALASLIFYSFGQLYYLPLFLFSVLINYFSGLFLIRVRQKKFVLTVSLILNIGLLCVFKYTNFIIDNLNDLPGISISPPGIVLPIGISFFTFQGMSYVIDVYRDAKSGTKDFMKVLLYLSFFPQLIAGPIVKYHDIANQLDHKQLDRSCVESGIQRFCFGLSKKVLIANAMGRVADEVFITQLAAGGAATDWRIAWVGAICYTLQIYYDFSGYSDMAIGLGRMFGFRFHENFQQPYASSTMQDFWRRWHISLSSWFKEYLYIPLGGNRKGKLRTAVNKLFVFLCTGIWHGANWTFLFWGLGHGFLTGLEGLGIIPAKRLSQTVPGRFLCRIYTLLSVILLFVIFRADSIQDGFSLIAAMFSGHVAYDAVYLLHSMLPFARIFILVAAIFFSGGLWLRIKEGVKKLQSPAFGFLLKTCSLALYVLSIMSLSRGGFNPFIYFQF